MRFAVRPMPSAALAGSATTGAQLATRLWWLVLLRGVVAVGLGASLLTGATGTGAVVTRVAAYWLVDGGVVIWAAAVAARHGARAWGLLARGLIVGLIGLWILGSPAVDVLDERYRLGWFVSFLAVVPVLLFLATFQAIFAAIVDVLSWLSVRRGSRGAWSLLVSAALAVATGALVSRAILGLAHPHAAATVAMLAGAAFLVSAVQSRAARPT